MSVCIADDIYRNFQILFDLTCAYSHFSSLYLHYCDCNSELTTITSAVVIAIINDDIDFIFSCKVNCHLNSRGWRRLCRLYHFGSYKLRLNANSDYDDNFDLLREL